MLRQALAESPVPVCKRGLKEAMGEKPRAKAKAKATAKAKANAEPKAEAKAEAKAMAKGKATPKAKAKAKTKASAKASPTAVVANAMDIDEAPDIQDALNVVPAIQDESRVAPAVAEASGGAEAKAEIRTTFAGLMSSSFGALRGGCYSGQSYVQCLVEGELKLLCCLSAQRAADHAAIMNKLVSWLVQQPVGCTKEDVCEARDKFLSGDLF